MRQLSRLSILGAFVLASCATTTITRVWEAPNFSGPPLRKVLVCAMAHDVAVQRRLEDAFVEELNARGVASTQCYSIFPDGRVTGPRVREALSVHGMDGFIDTKVTGVRDIPVYGTWPYYDAWGPETDAFYGPAYIGTETEVTLQTKAYSVAQNGALVWVGSSRTFDPSSLGSLVGQVVPRFIDAMTKADVLPAAQARSPIIGDAR